MHLVAEPGRGDADEPGVGGEADRIVDDIVDRAFEAVAVAHHRRRALARAREGDARARPILPGARGAAREHRFDHQSDVDRLEQGARELRVDAARVADVGDQPVEAADVLVGDGEQLRALRVGGDAPQPLDRRAHRGDRILELVRHVGGEMLARVDAFTKGLRHVAERACERADLVAAARQARDDDLARAAEADAHRGAREPPQRTDDRAREKQREQDRGDEHHRDDDREPHPFGADGAGDVARVERHQHHLGHVEIDDARGAEQRGAFGGVAEAAGGFARAESLDDLGPGAAPVGLRFLELGIGRRADDPVDAAIHRARGVAFPRLQVGIAQRVGRRAPREAVGKLGAVLGIEAQPRFGRAGEAVDQMLALIGPRRLQRLVELRELVAHHVHPRVDQARAIGVEIEEAAAEQDDREDVDREDARRQRPARRPDERRLLLLGKAALGVFAVSRHRRSGSPPRTASRSRRTRGRPRGTCGGGA